MTYIVSMYQVKKKVGRPRKIYSCKDCKDELKYELNKCGVFKCVRCLDCHIKYFNNLALVEEVNKICNNIEKNEFKSGWKNIGLNQ